MSSHLPTTAAECNARLSRWDAEGYRWASDRFTKSTHLIPTIRDFGGVLGMEIATGRVVVLRRDTEGY